MKKIEYTLKDICEKIWELEQKYDLFSIEEKGIPIWEIIRSDLVSEVILETGLYSQSNTLKNSFFDKIKYLPKAIYWSIFKNPFFSFKKVDNLIFEFSRKKFINNENVDIYTFYLVRKFIENKVNFEKFDFQNKFNHLCKNDNKIKYLDFLTVLTSIGGKILRFKISKKNLNIFKEVEKNISVFFNIKLNFSYKLNFIFTKNIIISWLFNILIKQKKPKKIYLVLEQTEYLKPLIKEAKKLGVETIELQHGIISNYHMAYSFPKLERNTLKCFSDKIYLWDDIFKKMCTNFPISNDKLIVKGFDYLEQQKIEFKRVEKKENQIIIISQGSFTKKISEIIKSILIESKEYTIIYKLHPLEYYKWRDFDLLVDISKYDNVKIIDNNEIPLYHFLAESKYLIGAYSTVVFEALHFDCKILLLDLPSVNEHMGPLIKDGTVKFIKKNEKIMDYIIGEN